MTAMQMPAILFALCAGAIILLGLVGLLWGLAVAASDTQPVREDDGEYDA